MKPLNKLKLNDSIYYRDSTKIKLTYRRFTVESVESFDKSSFLINTKEGYSFAIPNKVTTDSWYLQSNKMPYITSNIDKTRLKK